MANGDWAWAMMPRLTPPAVHPRIGCFFMPMTRRSISQRAAFHALRLRKEAQSPLVAGTVFGPHCGIICGWLCAGIDQITEALDRIQRMEIFTA